jgi:hypothetical protein
MAAEAAAGIEVADVAEVRTVRAQGTSEPPGQTTDVWKGLEPPDGRAGQARRLPIARSAAHEVKGVPYVTPFAWGENCGLLLPRYPGTRVVLVHRLGEASDPVDAGAIWESGHMPTKGKPGDWWLILPAEVAQTDREKAGAEKPSAYTGKATNDLIDADGDRFIEVGRLTVRVGRDALKAAGERPAAGSTDNFVAIEHKDNKTHVLIKQDGTIEIHAEADLKLSATKSITLTADKVDVSVKDAMTVK